MRFRNALPRIAAAAALLAFAGTSGPLAAGSYARFLFVPVDGSPARASGTVKGRDDVLYRFVGQAGQRLSVSLWTERRGTFFNVERPDGGEPLFVGRDAESGNFDRRLPDSGTYLLRVYQAGGAASEDRWTKYELTVGLEGGHEHHGGGHGGGGYGGGGYGGGGYSGGGRPSDWVPRVWEVDEGGWNGIWTRKGDSNRFRAVWRNKNGQEQRDELILESVRGDRVVFYRESMRGRYRITLSPDRTRIAYGTADWYRSGDSFKGYVRD
jgi:hypothetical protein